MGPPAQPADRYDPLPGVLGLPGHFWRKLSPGGRRVAKLAGVVLLAAGIVLAIVLTPRITESKREQAAEQRREEAAAAAAERARLEREQRPRHGRADASALASTAGMLTAVEQAVARDAQARHASGELDVRARGADCRTLGRDEARLLLGCTAVTSDVAATEETRGVRIGYPYRAAISTETGRYAICKTSGRPAEGLLGKGPVVELPPACGA
jgi:hypothetical protein